MDVLDMIRKSGLKENSTDPHNPAVRMLKAGHISDYCKNMIEDLNMLLMKDQLLQATRRIGYIGFNLPHAGTEKNPILPSPTNVFLSRTFFTYWSGEHADNNRDWTLGKAQQFAVLPRSGARSTFYFKPMSDPLVMDSKIIVPNHWLHIYEAELSLTNVMNAVRILNVVYEILALSVHMAKYTMSQPEIFDPSPPPLTHQEQVALLEVPMQLVRGLSSIRRFQYDDAIEYMEAFRKRQLLQWTWTTIKFRDQLAANNDEASSKMVSWVLSLTESEIHVSQMDMNKCLWEYFAFSLPNLIEPARHLLTKERASIMEKLDDGLKEANTFRESNPLGAENIMFAYLEHQLVVYRCRCLYLSIVHGIHDMPTNKDERQIVTRSFQQIRANSGVTDHSFGDGQRSSSSAGGASGNLQIEMKHLTQLATTFKREVDAHVLSCSLSDLSSFLRKHQGDSSTLRAEESSVESPRGGRGSPRPGQHSSPRRTERDVNLTPAPGGAGGSTDFERSCSVLYANMTARLREKSRNLRKDGSFILVEDELKDEVYLFVRSAKEVFDSIIAQMRDNNGKEQKTLRLGFQRALDHVEYLNQLREEDRLRRAININAGVVDTVAGVMWERDSLRKKVDDMVEIMEQQVINARDSAYKECEDRLAELEADNIFLRNNIKIQRESIVQEIMEGLGDIKRETVEKMVELVKKAESLETNQSDNVDHKTVRIGKLETEVELLKDENVTTMQTILKLKSMYQVKSAAAKLQNRKVTRRMASDFKIGNKQFWDNRDSAERKEELMQAQLDDLRARTQGTESALEKARREIKVSHEQKMKLLKWKAEKTQEIAEKDKLIEDYKKYTNAEMRHIVKRLQERNEELETMLGLDGRIDRRNTAMEGTLQTMSSEMKKLQLKVARERTEKLEAYNRLLFLELAGDEGGGDSVVGDGGEVSRGVTPRGDTRRLYQPLLTARTTVQEDVLQRRHTSALSKVQSLEHKCSVLRRALREVHAAGGPTVEGIVGKEVMQLMQRDEVPIAPRPVSVGYGQASPRKLPGGGSGTSSRMPLRRPSALHARTALGSGSSSRETSAQSKVRSFSVPDVHSRPLAPRPATVGGNQR